jgi:hypothetical protein
MEVAHSSEASLSTQKTITRLILSIQSSRIFPVVVSKLLLSLRKGSPSLPAPINANEALALAPSNIRLHNQYYIELILVVREFVGGN